MAGMVIVGAGECGIAAATALRSQGYSGDLTVIGEEANQPYEKPPLSKPGEDGAIFRPIAGSETLMAEGVIISGVSATGIDRNARQIALSNGGTLGYEKLLLATGAASRKLTCLGGEHALTLRSFDDAQAIYTAVRPGTSTVIVGAGIIGLELAAQLRERDVGVTVIEASPQALGRNVPQALANRLVERHEAQGVSFLFSETIARVDDSHVATQSGRAFPADLIVAAIGVVPCSELAESAGLTTDNGICVDLCLQTEDPNIFAAGDCASLSLRSGRRRFETWTNAQDQGALAATNMLGGAETYDKPVWFWSDQYDLGLQGVGDTTGDPIAIRSNGARTEILFYADAQGNLIGASGLGPGNAVAKDIKLAEKLIAKSILADAESLSDPTYNLKKMLRAA